MGRQVERAEEGRKERRKEDRQAGRTLSYQRRLHGTFIPLNVIPRHIFYVKDSIVVEACDLLPPGQLFP